MASFQSKRQRRSDILVAFARAAGAAARAGRRRLLIVRGGDGGRQDVERDPLLVRLVVAFGAAGRRAAIGAIFAVALEGEP